jgi:hypothetical protein
MDGIRIYWAVWLSSEGDLLCVFLITGEEHRDVDDVKAGFTYIYLPSFLSSLLILFRSGIGE